ncbi:hypothetical protein QTP88_029511 [Uroleucon formosanum]
MSIVFMVVTNSYSSYKSYYKTIFFHAETRTTRTYSKAPDCWTKGLPSAPVSEARAEDTTDKHGGPAEDREPTQRAYCPELRWRGEEISFATALSVVLVAWKSVIWYVFYRILT